MQVEELSHIATRLPPAAIILYQPDVALLARQFATLTNDGHRLILFANGPVDQATDRLVMGLADARVIRSPENQGLGFALNAVVNAVKDEGASHTLLLDQDSTPRPSLAAALKNAMVRHEADARKLAAVGPRLVPPPGENYRLLRYVWRDEKQGSVYFLPTSGSLISMEAWAAIGPFRADFFIDGIDVERGLRALNKGYECTVAKEFSLEHRWGTPVAAANGDTPQILRCSRLRCFFYNRNSVAMLRLGYVPVGWKLKAAGNLAAQVVLLLITRRFEGKTMKLVQCAMSAGRRGQLGSASSGVFLH